MHIPLLSDILIIFGLAIMVLFLCHKLHIPSIVGFLMTGVLAGPHGLGLIAAVHQVESLAEIGVVLLLFTLGIEFSMKDLWQLKRSVLIGGPFQVLATLLITFLIAVSVGEGTGKSIFIGFLVSLSSTAIVIKLLQDRAEVGSPHGKIDLSILIFQDIVAVPMMLMIPFIAGGSHDFIGTFLLLLLKGLAIVALALLSARWVVPYVLFHIAGTRSRELFLLTVVVICLAVAWLTSSIGLSLALGAFLAGLIISESEYSYQALSSLLPFKDVFTSIFFISIGMLVNVGILLQHPILIIASAIAVMLLKTITAGSTAAILGYPLRTMVLSGLALNQVGEFFFILSREGVKFGLLSDYSYQIFLAVSVLTMVSAPFVIAGAPRTADLIMRLPLPRRLQTGIRSIPESDYEEEKIPSGHLLIIGYGVNGRNVARAAKAAGIPYMIVEMNPITVKQEQAKGEPIYYGDASQEAVLEHVGIHNARVMVVAIPDPVATRMTVAAARNLNSRIHILARTRYLQEMEPLYALGANEVIPEEFETSVEIFSRVLAKYLVPRDEIERFIAEVRSDGYGMLRTLSQDATSFCTTSFCDFRLYLPDAEICSFRVQERSAVAGKSLGEIELRKKYGVTLLAIRRNAETISNPGANAVLAPNDISVLVGPPEELTKVKSLFSA